MGGIIKYFRFSYDYALWEIGYVNILMLGATIPDFDSDEKETVKKIIDFGGDPVLIGNYINNLQ